MLSRHLEISKPQFARQMNYKKKGSRGTTALVKSMTGYGRGEAAGEGFYLTVEIRTVNHRHLDVLVRTPRELLALEDAVRRILKEKLSRGRVEAFISLKRTDSTAAKVHVNENLAAAYLEALRNLQDKLGLERSPPAAIELIELPEILSIEKAEEDHSEMLGVLKAALEEAVDAAIQQREEEGRRLAADISSRAEELSKALEEISRKAPLVVEEYRKKLHERMEALHQGDYDRQRFYTEVAFFAERCNIDEEITRLRSHIDSFMESLTRNESIGRKLDFLMQEMFREFNTIASKSSDLDIARLVIDARSQVEKMREQIQNIE